MSEYFGKYKKCIRKPTNAMLDEEIEFLLGYTRLEISIALVALIGGIYLMHISFLVTIGGLVLGVIFARGLRYCRLNMQANFIGHYLWSQGKMNDRVELLAKRPEKRVLM